MTEARKRKPSPVDVKHDTSPAALEPGPTPGRRHLEGLAYYVVYMPAMFVAACCALLFVAAVERYLYNDA